MKKIICSLALTGLAISAMAQLVINNSTFFIESGAMVTVLGNVTSNVDIQGTGLMRLSGTTLQNIDMGGNTIPNLELNNTAHALLLNTNTRIGSSLLFTNGKLQTGNLNLTLSPTASVTGANSSRFVWTNGTGLLKKELTADIASFELPIGENTNYRPAYLTTSGSSYAPAASFGVRVVGAADPAKPPIAASYLNAYWPTTKTGITSGTITLTGQYIDPTDVTGTEANIFGYYNNGTDWSSVGETHLPASNTISARVTSDNGTVSGINKFLLVGARAFLQGAYNSVTGLMTDNLRALPFGSSASTLNFPSTDPYRVAPYSTTFTHVSNAAVETITSAAVLDQTGTNDDIVDWGFLDLRTVAAPTTVLQTRSALIKRNGDIVDMDGVSPVTFNNLANGNYVLAVRHRNHLGLRTDEVAFPKSINETKSTAFTTNVIDLRTATDAQVFGTSTAFKSSTHPGLGTVNLLWGGNANSNTTTRISGLPAQSDYVTLSAALGGNLTAILTNLYHTADMNMDRSVRVSGLPAQSDYVMLVTSVLGGDITKIISQQL